MNAKLQFKAYQDENMFQTVKQNHDHFNWSSNFDDPVKVSADLGDEFYGIVFFAMYRQKSPTGFKWLEIIHFKINIKTEYSHGR